jgi:hypothetical protein
MAVVQISRIQQRRGLQQDLPQLASAELGWSIDTQQLYIGNGTIAEGAPNIGVTEILTQNSDLFNIAGAYSFRGSESGYTSRTGPTADAPISRTLQSKSDELVSVRDFGAKGDGATDDTAAIQRAIDQILFGSFSLSQTRLRRGIKLPAGTYLLTSSLKLPSWAFLYGEGKDRTTIVQTNALFPVIQLKDSFSAVDSSYYTQTGSSPATNITIEAMTLQNNNATTDIVHLDSCKNIEFLRVLFRGSVSNSTSASGAQSGVSAMPTNAPATILPTIDNMAFFECEFYNLNQAVQANGTNYRAIGCTFRNMSRGIVFDNSTSGVASRNFKIINSTFHDIGRSAIYVNTPAVTTASSVMSSMNHFGEVGTAYAGAGNAVYPVINFVSGSGNYSIADNFWRNDADHNLVPRVYTASRSLNIAFDANTGISMGMMLTTTARTVTLSGNVASATPVAQLPAGTPAGTINYWLRRDNSSYRRGQIDYVINGTTVQYTDEYAEYPNATTFRYPGPTGITFSVATTSGNTFLYYTSDVNGYGNVTLSTTSFS